MFIGGVLLIVFGVFAIIGGAFFGGLLFIALGAFLVYRAKKKVKRPDVPVEVENPHTRISVVGTYYHRDNIEQILDPNPKMNKRGKWDEGEVIYHHVYFQRPCQLVPEPNNPSDPNAIMVMYDGKLIGYIPKEETAVVHRVIQDNNRIPILTIRSGPYTVFMNGEYVDRDDANYTAFIDLQ